MSLELTYSNEQCVQKGIGNNQFVVVGIVYGDFNKFIKIHEKFT